MITKDDKLLAEAYTNVNEGILDRMKARKGTFGQNVGYKALSGLGKLAGDTRMGKALSTAGEAGKQDVMEQKATQLLAIYDRKINELYSAYVNDASKLGLDLKSLESSRVTYPKLKKLQSFNMSFMNLTKKLQDAPVTAPVANP